MKMKAYMKGPQSKALGRAVQCEVFSYKMNSKNSKFWGFNMSDILQCKLKTVEKDAWFFVVGIFLLLLLFYIVVVCLFVFCVRLLLQCC